MLGKEVMVHHLSVSLFLSVMLTAGVRMTGGMGLGVFLVVMMISLLCARRSFHHSLLGQVVPDKTQQSFHSNTEH